MAPPAHAACAAAVKPARVRPGPVEPRTEPAHSQAEGIAYALKLGTLFGSAEDLAEDHERIKRSLHGLGETVRVACSVRTAAGPAWWHTATVRDAG